MPRVVASIVEGPGDQDALPKILHALARTHGATDLRLPSPIPLGGKHGLLAAMRRNSAHGKVRARLNRAANQVRAAGEGGVLILLDADKDLCPVRVAPQLTAFWRSMYPDVPCQVVLAKRMFEHWFIASGKSIARANRQPTPAIPRNVEDIDKDAAIAWIRRHLTDGRYKKTADQGQLATKINCAEATSRSRSFRKLVKSIETLLGVEEKATP